jgi:apolipoprotein N-acyltransferase
MTVHRFWVRRAILALGALAATAALLFFGTGLRPLCWLTWFAPFPVLFAAPRMRAWPAFAVAGFAWMVGSLNMWPEWQTVGLPDAVLFLTLALPATAFGLTALLFRAWLLRGGIWQAALTVPVAWVALEFLNAQRSPSGTFGNLGYTQADFLPIIQVVSIVGLWGISFCLLLVPAAAAALFSPQVHREQKQALFAGVLIFFAVALTFGFQRLDTSVGSRMPVNVALIASDQFAAIAPRDDDAALALYQRYADEVIRKIHGPGLSVAVLPEKIARLSDAGTKKLDTIFLDAALTVRVNILVGVDRATATGRSNEAHLYASNGTLAATYVKQHLLLPTERDDALGTEIKLLDAPAGAWGMAICKDMDFPGLSRQYGAQGAGMLLVPAWDFGLDGWLHSRMAVLRGVENGLTIVRTARQGLLTISDSRGRILVETSSIAAPITTLLATPSARHEETFYGRYGDWFGWSCVGGLCLSLLSLCFSQRIRYAEPGAERRTVVNLAAGMGLEDDSKARLLLDHGADPNARATFSQEASSTARPLPMRFTT